MKVFSVKVGLAGTRVVGSTGTSPASGDTAKDRPLSTGLATSVLPLEIQKRLLRGEQIPLRELDSLDISVVK